MFGVGVKLTALCVCLLSACATILGLGNDGVRLSVGEGRDVLLPCSLSTKENIESKLFDWKTERPKKEVFFYDGGVHYNNGFGGQDPQFKGRVSHFQEELTKGNASILITKTTLADSGNYTCDFPRLEPSQTFNINLVVFSLAPEPYVKNLGPTEDGALLQCVVRGASPKPLVQWQDRAGNILSAGEPHVTERGGSYDVTVLINVNKTDHYRCVSTQEEINHQTDAETFVYIEDKVPEDPSRTVCEDSFSRVVTGWSVGFGFGFLLGVLSLAAVLFVLLLTKHIIIHFNKAGCSWRRSPDDAESKPQHCAYPKETIPLK